LREIYHLAGTRELDNINFYVFNALTKEEREFIEKLNRVAEEYKAGERSGFISFQDVIRLREIWQKYKHLKPFRFSFDPAKRIPKVFQNKIAFIIWTTWKARHLTTQSDDIEGGSLAAAEILAKEKLPYSEKVKKEAVIAFLEHLHVGYPENEETELAFWEKYIFSYLEGKWKFRWEKIRKCFYCTKEAIAICDSCSPTSSTGLTPEKPLCEDCIVSSIGINIKRFLIPKFEAEKRINYALRKLKSKEIKSK